MKHQQYICSVEWLNSFIWPIGGTLTSTTRPGQREPGGIDKKNPKKLNISQSSRTRASPSDGLVSYPRHHLGAGLTLLQKCSWCILQPQPTGLCQEPWSGWPKTGFRNHSPGGKSDKQHLVSGELDIFQSSLSTSQPWQKHPNCASLPK